MSKPVKYKPYKYNAGGKQSVVQKAKGAMRKVFIGAAAAGVAAVPAYYQYGTIETETARVHYANTNYSWDAKAGEYKTEYVVRSSKGNFSNETSLLHAKFKGAAEEISGQLSSGKTYDITYYGIDFGPFERNILSVREVTEQELQARAQQRGANPAQAGAPSAQTQTGGAAAGALSGRMMTQDLVSSDGKTSVQVTVPVEAVGKVTVNSVTPIQPAAPAPAQRAPGL